MVFGPIAVTYNVNGLNYAEPRRAHAGENLQRRHHHLERSRDQGAQPRRHPARRSRSTSCSAATSPATTDNFQQYLDAASNGAWGKGVGKSFNGGVGEGAKGNDGTSAAIKSTDGSITYNEWSFAQAQQLNMAKIVTSAGPDAVAISTDSVGKTIAGATIKGQGNDLVLDTSRSTSRRSPAPTRSCSPPTRSSARSTPMPQTGTAVKAFLQTAIGAGQTGLADNGYIPIPDSIQVEAVDRGQRHRVI